MSGMHTCIYGNVAVIEETGSMPLAMVVKLLANRLHVGIVS